MEDATRRFHRRADRLARAARLPDDGSFEFRVASADHPMPDAPRSTAAALRRDVPGFATGQAILKPRKARPFYGRHPWVLASAIARTTGEVADGDVVDLVSDSGKFIARGLYNSQSRIRVRLYTWDNTQPIDDALLRGRLQSAVTWRATLGLDDSDGAARLVYSEADGLSGLVVDRYAGWLSIQVTALAMARRLDALVDALSELVQPRGIFVRTEKGAATAEGIRLRDGLYRGEPSDGTTFIVENGIRYGIDLAEGQKTGFYLDQRDNRLAAARYLRNRRVLDMFCYSGGFSLNAAVHGAAREVLGIDTSQKAVALASANAELNGLTNVRFEAGDCFETLETLSRQGEKFGAVVLDPPKFARSRSAVGDALRAYHRINRLAVDVLEPDGILVTCSCSAHVLRDDFHNMLLGVAERTGRDLQVLEARGAAPDHPVGVTCLESEYLKCFICRVL